VRTSTDVAGEHHSHLAVLHALDHLYRLDEALREPAAVFHEAEGR
jgi:hypothetical protein